ncbi:hypothetical protein JAO85_20660 [Comamonas sp. NyZ500]|uniref:hypothetical protein n=1 Tax=Comamonas sp. NyZ500 TaxID=2795732 RepID=UPI00192B0848|nr:hypothetical protein [Comamonas sp. NyZ500]MBL5979694.1 hypothetical protein [Comamonas sp. NyZ500]
MQAARHILPSVPITSAAFQYSNSASTNIAETFAKARERIAAEQAAQAKKQRRRTQHGPAVMTIKRVRAGTTNHLTLPLF